MAASALRASLAGYLAAVLCYSYFVRGPWDGTGASPSSWLWLVALGLVHVAAGAAIGRWWAVLLPLIWVALSVPAGGYDTPVWVIVLFQTPFLWAPAVLLGVSVRKLWPERLGAA